MEWVKDKIGEEYVKWKGMERLTGGDKIFISAPTGTGKTSFVLEKLLPYFSSKNKKILFLVNRRILKEQLEKDISRISSSLQQSIQVELYQSIENMFCTIKSQNMVQVACQMSNGQYVPIFVEHHQALNYMECKPWLERFDCVICDECHYFFADSNYNTNTIISYRLINEFFRRKIRIFMSATIEDFQKYIVNDEKEIRLARSRVYGFRAQTLQIGGLLKDGGTPFYSLDKNYNYLNINILNDKKDIVSVVTENSEKWLIFVDNIKYGMELKNELKERFKDKENVDDTKSEVIMLSAAYEDDEDSAKQVDEIIKNNKFTAKVIISTSVMDNGINIKDIELRNLIILADNRVEFIQMLGRKRKDEDKLKLYILKRKKDFFDRRLRQTQKLWRIARKYFEDFENKIGHKLSEEREPAEYIFEREKYLAYDKHKYIMHDIMNGKIGGEEVKKLFLAYDGVLYLNRLSVKNLENLNDYYVKLLDRFDEEGEDAFLREQLEWLGKAPNEIDDIINSSRTSTLEKYRAYVIEKIEAIVDKEMTKEENKEFKETIRKEVLYMLEQIEEKPSEYTKYHESFCKNERVISKPAMDFLREYCDLPYEIQCTNKTKTKDTYYTIKRYSGKN